MDGKCGMRWPALLILVSSIPVLPIPVANDTGGMFLDGWASSGSLPVQSKRASSQDLEIGGDLPGLRPGFIRYEDLLMLPQVTIQVNHDINFADGTKLSGVYLDTLTQKLSLAGNAVLISAVCGDLYEAHYTVAYRRAHRPILVLKIDDKPPPAWPPGYAPYLVSHSSFAPSFRVLSHMDEAQIPYGVVRLEFHAEEKALASIMPRGRFAANAPQVLGFKVAEQNCLRCHNQGKLGGLKGNRSWGALAEMAATRPGYFSAYIANPKSENPDAKMPAYSKYDEATRRALTAYFRTFSDEKKR